MATAFAAKEVEDENVGSDSGVESEEEVEEGAASEAGDSAADVAAAKAALERKLFDTPCLFLDVWRPEKRWVLIVQIIVRISKIIIVKFNHFSAVVFKHKSELFSINEYFTSDTISKFL